MAVDNITLALISLKQYLEGFLNDQGWKGKYRVFLKDDPFLQGKEIVEKVTVQSKEIGLPIVLLSDSSAKSNIIELGSSPGMDYVRLSIVIIAKDGIQLRTLSNLLRREVNDLNYSIYNYESRNEVVGIGSLNDVNMIDVSDYNSSSIASKYNSIINMTLELDANSFT
uniref:Uncharacterized protein n=1 Tax=viral metagenome TaxID=1070528 RepID=A0A6M3IID1_9ZZZZ